METFTYYLPYLLFALNFCLNLVLLFRRPKASTSTDWLSVVKYLVETFKPSCSVAESAQSDSREFKVADALRELDSLISRLKDNG